MVSLDSLKLVVHAVVRAAALVLDYRLLYSGAPLPDMRPSASLFLPTTCLLRAFSTDHFTLS